MELELLINIFSRWQVLVALAFFLVFFRVILYVTDLRPKKKRPKKPAAPKKEAKAAKPAESEDGEEEEMT